LNANLQPGRRPRRSALPPLCVIHLSIDLLKSNPVTAGSHSKKQIKQIARSIKAFGFNTPILVDADCNLIAGHARLQAARQLGLSEIPTIRIEHLAPAQARGVAIAIERFATGEVVP